MNIIYVSLTLLALCAPVELSAAAKPVTRDELVAGSTSCAKKLCPESKQENKTAALPTYFLLDALLIHCKLATHETLKACKQQFTAAWQDTSYEQRIKLNREQRPLFDFIASVKSLIDTHPGNRQKPAAEETIQRMLALSDCNEIAWPTAEIALLDKQIATLFEEERETHRAFSLAYRWEGSYHCQRHNNARIEAQGKPSRHLDELEHAYTQALNNTLERAAHIQSYLDAKRQERKNLLAAAANNLIAELNKQAKTDLPLPYNYDLFSLHDFCAIAYCAVRLY